MTFMRKAFSAASFAGAVAATVVALAASLFLAVMVVPFRRFPTGSMITRRIAVIVGALGCSIVHAAGQSREDSVAILVSGLAYLRQEYAMGDAVVIDTIAFRPRELMTSVAAALVLPLGSAREVVECVMPEPPGPCRMRGGATGVFVPWAAPRISGTRASFDASVTYPRRDPTGRPEDRTSSRGVRVWLERGADGVWRGSRIEVTAIPERSASG
jgi:hypothetical protein